MTITSEVGGHLAAVTACLVEDAYRDWNRATVEVQDALDKVKAASAPVAQPAEAAYLAAVEREERAAERLERMLDMAERLLPIDRN
ncbi:hypothetical protein [Amycolatopsis echigonensis]|uniref:Uncharacterized protein n=1 Tax=Amycolatopsis echigonensis TaxID=2576905 RepID=A0A8E1W7A9_9PSEU|nr:hypothetical protein [Amycolatopsis echigonensis]MBB2505146.1 hypothetical protein [Amycolatopsis echigonensis]